MQDEFASWQESQDVDTIVISDENMMAWFDDMSVERIARWAGNRFDDSRIVLYV